MANVKRGLILGGIFIILFSQGVSATNQENLDYLASILWESCESNKFDNFYSSYEELREGLNEFDKKEPSFYSIPPINIPFIACHLNDEYIGIKKLSGDYFDLNNNRIDFSWRNINYISQNANNNINSTIIQGDIILESNVNETNFFVDHILEISISLLGISLLGGIYFLRKKKK